MPRALASLALVSLAACEPALDRLTLSLTDNVPVVRMDLEPVTVAAGIDNTVSVDVLFDGTEGATGRAEFTQYLVEYRIGDQEAPPIAGEIRLTALEGGPAESITVRGAVEPQLDWVWERYTGDEMDVQARISLAGTFRDREGLLLTREYTATFADYR